MPSLRQFVLLGLLGLLWAILSWLTTAAWGISAQNYPFFDAFSGYYARRAPLVGAAAGMLWAPVLCAGIIPGRASALAHRPAGLAVEWPTRWLLRGIQGAVVGQLVGTTATFALLFLWPNSVQNTRMEAFKWGAEFWLLYWWLFVPCSAVAGVLSVTIAHRTVAHRTLPRSADRLES